MEGNKKSAIRKLSDETSARENVILREKGETKEKVKIVRKVLESDKELSTTGERIGLQKSERDKDGGYMLVEIKKRKRDRTGTLWLTGKEDHD